MRAVAVAVAVALFYYIIITITILIDVCNAKTCLLFFFNSNLKTHTRARSQEITSIVPLISLPASDSGDAKGAIEEGDFVRCTMYSTMYSTTKGLGSS